MFININITKIITCLLNNKYKIMYMEKKQKVCYYIIKVYEEKILAKKFIV